MKGSMQTQYVFTVSKDEVHYAYGEKDAAAIRAEHPNATETSRRVRLYRPKAV